MIDGGMLPNGSVPYFYNDKFIVEMHNKKYGL